MKLFAVKQQRVVAAMGVAGAVWCLVYAGYVGHIAAGQARYILLDFSLVGFALIHEIDKIAAPIAQLIFKDWFAGHTSAELIAGGMLCGNAFGIVGGVFLIAWNIERGFRGSDQHAAIEGTLRSISKVCLTIASIAIALGAWYTIRLAGFMLDGETVTTVLLAGLLSGFGAFCAYAALSWLTYWGVIAGRQLWNSIRSFQ